MDSRAATFANIDGTIRQQACRYLHATARFIEFRRMIEVVPERAPVATFKRGLSRWKKTHREWMACRAPRTCKCLKPVSAPAKPLL